MVCIGIALVFWLLLKMSKSFVTKVEFGIEYSLPPGLVYKVSPPSTITANIRGQGWDLLSNYFKSREPIIAFNLVETESQGINATQFKDKIAQKLPTVEVLDVSEDYVLIDLDPAIEKRLPIRLEHNINFEAGYQLKDSIRLQPDSLTISGPISLLEKLSFWPTVLLSKNELQQGFTQTIEIAPPVDPVLQCNVEKVNVVAEVEQFTEKDLFVALRIKNAPDSLKIFPEKIQLSCLVGVSRFNEVVSDSFDLVVDLKGIPLNTANNTVPILLKQSPSFVRNVRYYPPSVEFFFVRSNLDSLLTQ